MKLLPCPFCGDGEVHMLGGEEYMGSRTPYWVQCPCSAGGACADTMGDAAKAWNKRSEPKRCDHFDGRHGHRVCGDCGEEVECPPDRE